MLLTTVLLWALNLSVTKYILTHGLQPLSYATVRYGLAGLIFVGLTLYASARCVSSDDTSSSSRSRPSCSGSTSSRSYSRST